LKALSALLPAGHSKSFKLDTEDVWNSLFLYWLINDVFEQEGEVLQLPHNEKSQARRLKPALHARNLRMVGPGQEQWSHVCDLCCWIDMLPDGKTFSMLISPR